MLRWSWHACCEVLRLCVRLGCFCHLLASIIMIRFGRLQSVFVQGDLVGLRFMAQCRRQHGNQFAQKGYDSALLRHWFRFTDMYIFWRNSELFPGTCCNCWINNGNRKSNNALSSWATIKLNKRGMTRKIVGSIIDFGWIILILSHILEFRSWLPTTRTDEGTNANLTLDVIRVRSKLHLWSEVNGASCDDLVIMFTSRRSHVLLPAKAARGCQFIRHLVVVSLGAAVGPLVLKDSSSGVWHSECVCSLLTTRWENCFEKSKLKHYCCTITTDRNLKHPLETVSRLWKLNPCKQTSFVRGATWRAFGLLSFAAWANPTAPHWDALRCVFTLRVRLEGSQDSKFMLLLLRMLLCVYASLK